MTYLADVQEERDVFRVLHCSHTAVDLRTKVTACALETTDMTLSVGNFSIHVNGQRSNQSKVKLVTATYKSRLRGKAEGRK